MKKIRLILIIIFVLNTFFVYCLDISIGLKSGLGFCNYFGDDYRKELFSCNMHNEMVFGFSAGFFLNLQILKYFAIEQEILFTSFGGGKSSSIIDYTYYERLAGLELPLLFQITIPANKLKVIFSFGPDMIIRFGEHRWITQNPDNEGVNEFKNLRNVFPNFISSIGIKIALAKKIFISTDLRNELMLIDMFSDPVFKQKLNRLKFVFGIGFIL